MRRFELCQFHGSKLTVGPAVFVGGILLVLSLRFGLLPFWYVSLSSSEYWWMAAMITLGIFLSLVLHDMSHLVVARLLGSAPSSARVMLFGELPATEKPKDLKNEWKIALIGPLFSLALGATLFYFAVSFDKLAMGQVVVGIFFHVAAANVTLAILNFIPFFPLDGGKLMRAILWKRTHSFTAANEIASFGGTALAFAIVFVGLSLILHHHLMVGGWTTAFGIVVGYAAYVARHPKL